MAIAGSNLDGVRRSNLATILERVHHGGTVSRAQLTIETGLNRSTIAALVSELAGLGLVNETTPEATNRVGRPSPLVVVDSGPVVIAVNPELDAITVGVVGLGARVVHRVRHPVDHATTPDEMVRLVSSILAAFPAEVLAGHRVLAAGVAVPGLVAAGEKDVRWAPHLGWTDVPLAELLSRAIDLPVVVGNDASLGAVAERLFGAGRGVDDLVYLNGGASGIGGGVIAGGRLLGGHGGFAGEFGHNRPGVADADDRLTVNGTLEDEVSRARLLAAVGLDAADDAELGAAVLGSRDPALRAELARQRRILSTALSNAINLLDPELIVLGGFLATLLATNRAELESLVEAQAIPAAWHDVGIRPAGLGADLLMIGAAELALAPLLADPAAVGRPPAPG
jgi:predicted NBD/HSP70 family sugar kinase